MSVLLSLSAFATPLTVDDVDVDTLEDATPVPDAWIGDSPDGIINGEPATADDWPMAGGMLAGGTVEFNGQEISGNVLMCSATRIAPDVVLLAAHCVDLDGMLAEYERQAGAPLNVDLSGVTISFSGQADLSMFQLDLSQVSDPLPLPEDAATSSDWAIHGGWDFAGLQIGLAVNDDIALLFLDQADETAPIAYLPSEEEGLQLEVGNEVVVVGWGQRTSDQQPPPGTVGHKYMGTSFVAEKGSTEFKVGEVATDVRKCHGDSGGPSFMEVETDSAETWRVVGVTSHAYDFTDCRETGGVDTRVSAYLDWIDDEMTSRCDDGTRAWCLIPGIIPPPDENGVVAWDGLEAGGTSDDGEDEKKGCGCATNNVALGFLPALLGLLAIRRR